MSGEHTGATVKNHWKKKIRKKRDEVKGGGTGVMASNVNRLLLPKA